MAEESERNLIISAFGPNIIIVVAYLVLLIALFFSYGVRMEFSHFKLWTVLLSTLFFIYVTSTVVQHWRRHESERLAFFPFAFRSFLRFIKDWLPIIALVTIYENLREYTGIIRTDSIDAFLYRADVAIFGVEPTVWIQKFTHPIATEYFAFTYSLYLILPLSLGWLFYLFSKRSEFHHLCTAVIFCLCMGFLLYLVFPAGPPRFFIPDLFEPRQLVGYFGYYNSMQAKFDAVNPMTYRASFPSLHVALSSLALVYVVKFRKAIPFGKIFQFVYGLLVVSLWIATVYLRHHWVVDIFAGWVVAMVSVLASGFVQRRWPANNQ